MARLLLYLLPIGVLCLLSSAVDLQEERDLNIVFVIISQSNRYNEKKAENLKQDIIQQAKSLNYNYAYVYLTHKDFPEVIAAWTFYPLFERLSVLHNGSWIFFCEETTRVDVGRLTDSLTHFEIDRDYFLGYALQDNKPTVIHHYAPTDSDSLLLYPDTSAGFLISPSLIHKSAVTWRDSKIEEFSIDSGFELATIMWNGGKGTKMLSVLFLCLFQSSEYCSTWVGEIAPECGFPVPQEQLYFAVKTYQKFHEDRVPVVKNTWARQCSSIFFFSDVEDLSVPTINIGVENVPRGHCEKTLSILRYVIDQTVSAEWVIVADDDTLLSPTRLQKLLSCYNATEDIALGERYAYGVAGGQGYDYVTGGGGMVFSMPVVRKLASSCTCPSIDSPDDMIIGLCLRNLGIPVLNSPYFHQARPDDYCSEYLSHQKSISFHKHWMVDPYYIYNEWLEDNETYPIPSLRFEL